MDLENLKTLATQAAKSDFLWELGMRVHSGNEAKDICKRLSVPLVDEKRVKAVMRLREENPQVLLEISNDAVDEGDETMVEVRFGPERYRKIATAKDRELWHRIATNLEIPTARNIREDFYNRKKSADADAAKEWKLPPWTFDIHHEMLWESKPRALVTAVFQKPSVREHDHSLEDGGSEIRIFSGTYPSIDTEGFYPPGDWAGKFFYVPNVPEGEVTFWHNAVVVIYKDSVRSFATKLARAYEAETARRRKPAKAVVLKNY